MALNVTGAEYDAALDRAERDLVELARRLDRPVPREMYDTALLVLGHRARTLHNGLVSLVQTEARAACVALIRPAVEINLTARFLVASPELHAELWVAEGERQNAVILRELEADRDLVAKVGTPDVDANWHRDVDNSVEGARAKARAAGVVGIDARRRKPVFPSAQSLATNHGDLATREAYTLAYRALSQFMHGSARSFGVKGFKTAGSTVEFDDAAAFDDHDARSHRALNATTFASTLCVLSAPLDLDVFADADLVKGVILGITADR
jgi:hypothetical protein